MHICTVLMIWLGPWYICGSGDIWWYRLALSWSCKVLGSMGLILCLFYDSPKQLKPQTKPKLDWSLLEDKKRTELHWCWFILTSLWILWGRSWADVIRAVHNPNPNKTQKPNYWNITQEFILATFHTLWQSGGGKNLLRRKLVCQPCF